MIDDLKERLWEIERSGCNPYVACRDAAEYITDLEARLAAAEAEAKEQKADASKWFGVALENKHRAEAAEAGEDALEEALRGARSALKVASRQLTEDHRGVLKDRVWGEGTLEIVSAALAAYEARRKG